MSNHIDRRAFMGGLGATFAALALAREGRLLAQAASYARVWKPAAGTFVYDGVLLAILEGRTVAEEWVLHGRLCGQASDCARLRNPRDVGDFPTPDFIGGPSSTEPDSTHGFAALTFPAVEADGELAGVMVADGTTPILWCCGGGFPITPTGGDVTVMWAGGLVDFR